MSDCSGTSNLVGFLSFFYRLTGMPLTRTLPVQIRVRLRPSLSFRQLNGELPVLDNFRCLRFHETIPEFSALYGVHTLIELDTQIVAVPEKFIL